MQEDSFTHGAWKMEGDTSLPNPIDERLGMKAGCLSPLTEDCPGTNRSGGAERGQPSEPSNYQTGGNPDKKLHRPRTPTTVAVNRKCAGRTGRVSYPIQAWHGVPWSCSIPGPSGQTGKTPSRKPVCKVLN